jgi:hypothetical protein
MELQRMANRRAVWRAYVALVMVMMAWPGVQVRGPVPRSDLWVHFGVFGLLSLVTWWACVGGRKVLVVWLIAATIGVVTELGQLIPMLNRTFGIDDMVFNVLGAGLGAAGSWAWWRVSAGGSRSTLEP